MLHAAHVPSLENLENESSNEPLASVLRAAQASPGLMLAFVAEADKAGVGALQAQCRARGVPLAGGIFPALVAADGFLERGAWLTWVPGATRVFLDPLPADENAAADALSEAIEPNLTGGQVGEGAPLLFSLFDACTPNIGSVLDALYRRVADGVRYLGACAGSGSFAPMPCLFDERRVLGDAALCVLLPPDMRSSLSHGYGVPDEELTATATTGNRIRSINWANAFETYRDCVRQAGFTIDRDNFYEHAVHFPFGLLLGNGRAVVRIPVGLFDDGSIAFAGEVPNDALLTMLTAPAAGSRETVERIAKRLGAVAPDEPIFAFYCAGRRSHLGDAAVGELRALARASGAKLVGALSLGEVGCLDGMSYPYFHNGAVFCAAPRT